MRNLLLFAKWILKAWPLLIIILTATTHLILFKIIGKDIERYYKLASLLMQVIGSTIVIYTINQNIELLKQSSILKQLKSYIYSCPYFKQRIVEASGTSFSTKTTVVGHSFEKRHAETTEERIDELQRQIEAINTSIVALKIETSNEINSVKRLVSANKSQQENELKFINSNLSEAIAGGIHIQIFGIALAIYGSIIGALA